MNRPFRSAPPSAVALLAWLGLPAFSALLAACGAADLPPSAISGYNAPIQGNKAQSALQGSWSTPCVASGAGYTRSSILFFGTQFSELIGQFSDGQCKQLAFQATVGKDYTLTGDPNAATQPMTTVDRQNTGVATTGNSSAADSAAFCGLTHWVDNVAQDVSGRTCLGLSVPAVNQTASESVTFVSSTVLSYASPGIGTQTYTKDP